MPGLGRGSFLIALVQVVGDGVAAQGESDHDAVLAGGAVGGHASAVEGAVEGVVEALAVLAPSVAAVVQASAVVGLVNCRRCSVRL